MKLLCVFSLLTTLAVAQDFADELLGLTPDSRARLEKNRGLVEVVPVILPEGKNLLGVNDHFGWPIATMAGKSIVLTFYRQPQHWKGKDQPDADTSGAVAIRSTDGGKTWSEPVNLRALVKQPTKGCRAGFGNSIGTDADGAVVVVTSAGVFRSEDEGASWQHLPGAFGERQLSGSRTNNGPRLLLHPEYGLVVFGHEEEAGKKNPDGTPIIAPRVWVRWSKDGGRTWQETKQEVPYSAVEPAALMHEGALFLVGRCHTAESYEPGTKTWRYVQFDAVNGWLPLRAALSTIRATDVADIARNRYHGPWSQDTVELGYNPASRRIECVATDRNGDAGAGEKNARDCQTLNLWSIDPAVWKRGETEWRFESTLLKRAGLMGKSEIDGMHPGAAVIDPVAKVQHIFIYAGKPEGPSGIFRVSRTLDTARLKE